MIVKQRNSDAETEFSAEIRPQLDKYEMSIDFDYKELICLDDIIKQTWDCYLSLMINGEKHLVRVTWEERSEEHTSELQSRGHLVCRLLLEKKKTKQY